MAGAEIDIDGGPLAGSAATPPRERRYSAAPKACDALHCNGSVSIAVRPPVLDSSLSLRWLMTDDILRYPVGRG